MRWASGGCMIPGSRTAILTLRTVVGGAFAAWLVCASHAAGAADVTYACYVPRSWGGIQPGSVVQIGVANLDGAATRRFIAQLCADTGVVPRFRLDGRIDAATTAKIRSLAAFVRAQKGFAWRLQAAIATTVVTVSSDGGDLAEALAIGRLFR